MASETEYLVKKAKRQDPDAFTQLMQIHMKEMYRVALSILMNDEDAADAIGDTILACWEKIGSLKETAYVRTWMIRILMNKCYDIRKKNKRYISLDECEEPSKEDSCNLELKEALAVLDEKYRVIRVLFYSEGYHIDEIAKLLKIPKSTVATRLSRGRKRLKEYLSGNQEV